MSFSIAADAGLESEGRGVGATGGDEHELHRVAGDLAPAGYGVLTE